MTKADIFVFLDGELTIGNSTLNLYSALTGANAILKSHDLVVLMLACEDFFHEQTGRDLEWPKHVNGILKTVGTLADFLEKA